MMSGEGEPETPSFGAPPGIDAILGDGQAAAAAAAEFPDKSSEGLESQPTPQEEDAAGQDFLVQMLLGMDRIADWFSAPNESAA